MYFNRGNYAVALEIYKKALFLASNRPNFLACVVSNIMLGSVYYARGDYISAVSMYDEVDRLWRKIKIPGTDFCKNIISLYFLGKARANYQLGEKHTFLCNTCYCFHKSILNYSLYFGNINYIQPPIKKRGIAKIYLERGNVYLKLSKFENSRKNLRSAQADYGKAKKLRALS